MMDNSIEIKMDTGINSGDITINIFKETNIIFKENSVRINVSRRLLFKELNLPEDLVIDDIFVQSSGSRNLYIMLESSEEYSRLEFDEIVSKFNKSFKNYGHVNTSSYLYGRSICIILECDILQKFSTGVVIKHYKGNPLRKIFKMTI